MPKNTRSVTLQDPRTGNYETFLPGTLDTSDLDDFLDSDNSDETKAYVKSVRANDSLWDSHADDLDSKSEKDLRQAADANGTIDEDFEDVTGAARDDLDQLTVPELRTLAEANEVDLGTATKKADIVDVLREAGVTARDAETEE